MDWHDGRRWVSLLKDSQEVAYMSLDELMSLGAVQEAVAVSAAIRSGPDLAPGFEVLDRGRLLLLSHLRIAANHFDLAVDKGPRLGAVLIGLRRLAREGIAHVDDRTARRLARLLDRHRRLRRGVYRHDAVPFSDELAVHDERIVGVERHKMEADVVGPDIRVRGGKQRPTAPFPAVVGAA